MSDIKYGHVEGPGHGKELPLAADQYFHRLGGHFVDLDSTGAVTLCASDSTEIYGWAVAPKQASGYSSWKGSATAKVDKVFVITGLEDRFLMPMEAASASANATILVGGMVPHVTGSTYTTKQIARYNSTAASNLLDIYDFDADNQTCIVGIRPTKKAQV